jgi:alpha-methylacyl-CoA racemase
VSTAVASGALAGVRVIDFSTLLPGPLCTLMLARAGAEVTKVERPDGGDEMRSYTPRLGPTSVNFALLNQGKRSIALDLKRQDGVRRALELLQSADVLVEQYRPGVMERFGLGYEAVRAVNPRLVYCSITGWGQHGPLAGVAAHDLNYQAISGVLGLSAGADGAPVLPNVLAADIAGGAYPAVMNILLALRQRDATGSGCHLDIAMADNLFALAYWGLGDGFAAGQWPGSGDGLVTGGSPRYQIYRTRDDRYLACAPLEDKFWRNFLAVLEAPQLLDDAQDPAGVRRAVAALIAARTADEWVRRFDGIDACVSVVRTLQEAVQEPHFHARGVFDGRVSCGDGPSIPALPLPVSAHVAADGTVGTSPLLGEHGGATG